MIKYSMRTDGYGEAITCACCEFPAPLAEIRMKYPGTEIRLLCEVCSSTYFSRMLDAPLSNKELIMSLGWIVNRLIQALENGKVEN